MSRLAPLLVGILYVTNVGVASAGYRSCASHGKDHTRHGSNDAGTHQAQATDSAGHSHHTAPDPSEEGSSEQEDQACDGKCSACSLTLSSAPGFQQSPLGELHLDLEIGNALESTHRLLQYDHYLLPFANGPPTLLLGA